jgi:hypothetical protein
MRAPNVRMKVLSAAITVLLACGVGACSSGSGHSDLPAQGPLSSGLKPGDIPRGVQCAPGREGPFTFADQEYTNYGHRTVVLDRVTLLDPHNQRLIGSYAMPGQEVIGSLPWPPRPAKGFPLPAEWKHRQPVPGFRLAPGKSFNMVLGVAAISTGRRSTSTGILVYYHDSAGSYLAKNYFANIIAATKNGCLRG